MGKHYDIAQRIAAANVKPTVKIDDEHEYTINVSKSTAIMVMALSDDIEGKPEAESVETMDKMINLALGKAAAEYIESLDLTMSAYQLVIKVIIAAFSDSELDEIEEEVEEAKDAPKK